MASPQIKDENARSRISHGEGKMIEILKEQKERERKTNQ